MARMGTLIILCSQERKGEEFNGNKRKAYVRKEGREWEEKCKGNEKRK